MTRPTGERPATAEALYAFLPGVLVVRRDIGDMQIGSTAGSGYRCYGLNLFLTTLGGENAPGSAVGLTTNSDAQTSLLIPRGGTIDEMQVQRAGEVDPEDVIGLARDGLNLFHGLLGLPPDERIRFGGIPNSGTEPSGNMRAYDNMRSSTALRQDLIEAMPDGADSIRAISERELLLDVYRYALPIFLPDLAERSTPDH